MDWEALIK